MNTSKFKILALIATLPTLIGCGVGVASLGSFLFGSSAAGLSLAGGGGLLPPVGGAGISTITNPEPASMFLIGSGMAAMTYIRAKSKKNNDK